MKNTVHKLYIISCICVICGLFCISPARAQDDLPEGWFHEDIGEPPIQSKLSYDESTGTYIIDAGGKDMWGTEDHGHFLYFETEEDKEVVARVLDLQANTRNGKVTIMIRGSMDYNAAMALVEIRKDNKAIFYYRPTDAGHTTGDTEVDTKGYPWWIKFVRQGSYVSAYQKSNADTAQWQMISTPAKIAFKGKAYMGIAVCGGDDGTSYATAKVDNIVVQDIENPYEVRTEVTSQVLNEGETKDINVTGVFGHFIGDYWTIQPTSTDESVAIASFREEAIKESERKDGEPYQKYIRVVARKDGIAAIRMYTNLMGFKMTSEFLVEVKGADTPSETITPMSAPSPWVFTDLPVAGVKSWMEYTGSIDQRLKIVTEQKDPEGIGDRAAFLYQPVSRNDDLEMKIYIDSLKNTGAGSFAGFMLRESLNDNTPFISYGVGAYEGLRLTYKWDAGSPAASRSLPDVSFPCWIMMRKYKDETYGNSLLRVFYSYDNIYWQELLKYPLTLDFLTQDLMAGVGVTGGAYTNSERKGSSVMNGLSLKINQGFEEIQGIDDLESQKIPLTMSPNILANGQMSTITYKVIKPGRVTVSIYDSYGNLVEVLRSETQGIGIQTLTYTANLPKTGVYMLRVVSESNYQYIKFVFTR